MSKSIARRLLETTLKEDDQALPGVPGGSGDAAAAPDGKAPDAAQPSANDSGVPGLKAMLEEHAKDPDGMANMMDQMHAHAGKFMDEADDATYTCKDVQDKDDVQKGMDHMQECMGVMRGKKM